MSRGHLSRESIILGANCPGATNCPEGGIILGGDCPGGIVLGAIVLGLGGNCSGSNFPRWQLSRWELSCSHLV